MNDLVTADSDSCSIVLSGRNPVFKNDSEAKSTARTLGLVCWKPKRIRCSGRIGRFLAEQGILSVGRGMHFVAIDMTERAIKECSRIIEQLNDGPLDGELRDWHRLRKELVGLHTEIAKNLIKSDQEQSDDTAGRLPAMSFRPDQKVPAITGNGVVNVLVQSSNEKG